MSTVVHVDQRALIDPRFMKLGRSITGRLNQSARRTALGMMICVWFECYARKTTTLSLEDIDASVGREGFSHLVLESGLGRMEDGQIYLCGTQQRIFPTRGNIRGKKRQAIIDRDSAACVYCGVTEETIEIDHVIPVSRGGSDDESNLVAACKPCNRDKGAQTPEEWLN